MCHPFEPVCTLLPWEPKVCTLLYDHITASGNEVGLQAERVWCMELPAGLMFCLMAPHRSAGCPPPLASPPLTGTPPVPASTAIPPTGTPAWPVASLKSAFALQHSLVQQHTSQLLFFTHAKSAKLQLVTDMQNWYHTSSDLHNTADTLDCRPCRSIAQGWRSIAFYVCLCDANRLPRGQCHS